MIKWAVQDLETGRIVFISDLHSPFLVFLLLRELSIRPAAAAAAAARSFVLQHKSHQFQKNDFKEKSVLKNKMKLVAVG